MPSIRSISIFALIILSLALGACQTTPPRPTFYPNPHLTAVGNEKAQNDSDACMAQATQYGVKEKKDGKVGQKAAKGATLGAITAGAWGLVTGDAGERALAGAAAGAAGGAASGAMDANNLDPVYKSFVQKCLADQGYSIIGWQ